MDALPIIARVAELLDRHGLEAVLIGNAAAALHGAPVTTVDLDFLFRRNPANVRKLAAIAAELHAMLMKPVYPVSGLLRISRDEDGLQLNFMDEVPGVRSFEALRKRATEMYIGETRMLVASQSDSKSKKAAGRPRDLAVPAVSEKALEAGMPSRKTRLAALTKETDLAERELIRRLQALPMEKRTHFLRKRVGLRMSCI